MRQTVVGTALASVPLRRSRLEAAADYAALAKPRTIVPHLVTAAAAMFLAAHGLPRSESIAAVLAGGGLTAGACNAFNCVYDRDIDALMPRTRGRPLAGGRLKPRQALAFGAVAGLLGLLVLGLFVGPAASALAAAALVYYVLVYTMALKRRTPWSGLISCGAGAFPPLIGWLAVTGGIALTPLLLFAIVSLWTLPHFWSLAVWRRREYESARIGILPARPGVWILAFSTGVVGAAFLLIPIASLGLLYVSVAAALAAGLLALAVPLAWSETPAAGKRLYVYSVAYIMVLFASMIGDRLSAYLR